MIVEDNRVTRADGVREAAAADAFNTIAWQSVHEAYNAAHACAPGRNGGKGQCAQTESERDVGLPVTELRDEARDRLPIVEDAERLRGNFDCAVLSADVAQDAHVPAGSGRSDAEHAMAAVRQPRDQVSPQDGSGLGRWSD